MRRADVTAKQRQDIICLRLKGFSYKKISTITKVSQYKVSQVISNYIADEFPSFEMPSGTGRAKEGIHYSPKSDKPIEYKSGLELSVCLELDNCDEVSSYQYETLMIAYKQNARHKRVKRYIPDFIIYYKDQSKPPKVIEVKPKKQVSKHTNSRKFEAARQYCDERGLLFEVWTEKEIKNFRA